MIKDIMKLHKSNEANKYRACVSKSKHPDLKKLAAWQAKILKVVKSKDADAKKFIKLVYLTRSMERQLPMKKLMQTVRKECKSEHDSIVKLTKKMKLPVKKY